MNPLKYLDLRRVSKTNRYYFLFNIVLGLGTLFFLVITRDSPLQQGVINALFDQAIEFRTGLLEWGRACDAKIAAKKVVMLSFDDEAIKDLRYPHITPRNKIADLIRFAYKGGASVVIVDMSLSDPDYTPTRKFLGDSKPMTGQERDQELFDLLEQIKNDVASNTRIVISADIYTDKTMQDSDFANLIDNKKIYVASTAVSGSRGNDRTVRFWLPYLEIIEEDDDVRERKVLWSFQLLALALTEGGEEELSRISQDILHGDETKFTMHCKSGRDFVFYRELSLPNGTIRRDTQSLQYNRIQYVFTPQKWVSRTVDKNNIGYWRDNSLDPEDIDFKDKVVIIGREDKECNDFIATLIGRIPGMYVQGNAVATILGKTQPHISPLWKYILIEIILIVVTAYVFVYRQYSGAKRFVFVLTILCWFFSYIYFWLTNEFVYLTCSFASIGVYNFVNRMEQFFKRRRSVKMYLKKLFRRKSDKDPVSLDK